MEMLKQFILAILLGFALGVLVVHAQDQSGFISLDCGLPKDSNNYTEATTGIDYMSDANFIETGTSKMILQEFQTNVQQQLWYLRSFPEGTRNCYSLNLTRGDRYLIRANFLYGNYDQQNKAPEFDLHLGPNLWDSVRIENASTPIVMEMIHVLSSNYLYVCLVNKDLGTPFISALELRLLNKTTYVTQTGSLEFFTRLDVGSTTNKTFRYKEDVYDRVWLPYNFYEWTQVSASPDINWIAQNDYQPPPLAMRTAATPKNANASLDIELQPTDPNSQFYVYMHFGEVEVLQANESRELRITFNNNPWFGPFVPGYLTTTTVFSPAALTGGNYVFSIVKTENSTHPPILNAMEIYTVKELLQSQTNQMDVDAINNIKSTYGVKRNWQGDPCVPQAYLWDGLNCSNNGYDPPSITSLNLSSSGLTGEISLCLSNLTSIQYLDLSNNSLTGSVPEFLSQLLSLTVLNLNQNKLTGMVPAKLLERSNDGSLKLSVDGNPDLCASVSCKKKNKFLVPVVASVASFFVLIATLAILWILRRRKQHVGKLDSKSNTTCESFELKSLQFTYSDVLRITNNFKRVLGKGGFGTVYHGCLDDTQVAVKMLSASSAQGYKQFQAEVKLLVRVHHRNLTTLVGYCDDGTNMGLIYEYMANGNLAEHLSDSSTNILNWEERLQIALEAAQGLEYLHNGCKPPIVHRDVKSTNILLNDKFEAKLADFGLSRIFPTDSGTHVSTIVAGTPGYLDPEYYISYRLNDKSDVYSFGVVLLEIISSRPVVIAEAHDHEKIHISQWVSSILAKGDIKNVVDPRLQGHFDINSVWKVVEIAMACVSPTSTRRPNMNHVVMELSECLTTEIARTKRARDTESKDSYEIIDVNPHSELTPLAR